MADGVAAGDQRQSRHQQLSQQGYYKLRLGDARRAPGVDYVGDHHMCEADTHGHAQRQHPHGYVADKWGIKSI